MLPHEDVYWREKETYMHIGQPDWTSQVLMPIGVTEVYFPLLEGVDKVTFVNGFRMYKQKSKFNVVCI